LRVDVELSNDGDEDVWAVGVVDGSEAGVRYPRWRPAVLHDGRAVATPPAPEEAMTGPLRAVDFRRLAPGEAFDPTAREAGAAYLPLLTFATFAPQQPGAYTLTLELSTESERPDEWLGSWGQDRERDRVLELVKQVPRMTIRSNDLVVEVAEQREHHRRPV
jgi:hypothetical protein